MTLRTSETAATDLENIYDYIAKENCDAALETVKDLYGLIERLLEFPQLGRSAALKTRELLQPPFVIVYRIVDDVISIEAVFSSTRSRRI